MRPPIILSLTGFSFVFWALYIMQGPRTPHRLHVAVSGELPSLAGLDAATATLWRDGLARLEERARTLVAETRSGSVALQAVVGLPGSAVHTDDERAAVQAQLDCGTRGTWTPLNATDVSRLLVHKQASEFAVCDRRWRGNNGATASLRPSLAYTFVSECGVSRDVPTWPVSRAEFCRLLAHKSILLVGDITQYELHDLLLDVTSTRTHTCYGDMFCKEHMICADILEQSGEDIDTFEGDDSPHLRKGLVKRAEPAERAKRNESGEVPSPSTSHASHTGDAGRETSVFPGANLAKKDFIGPLPSSLPISPNVSGNVSGLVSDDAPLGATSFGAALDTDSLSAASLRVLNPRQYVKSASKNPRTIGTVLRYQRTDTLVSGRNYNSPEYLNAFSHTREVNQKWYGGATRSDIVIMNKAPVPMPVSRDRAGAKRAKKPLPDVAPPTTPREVLSVAFQAIETEWLPKLMDSFAYSRTGAALGYGQHVIDSLIVYRGTWRIQPDCHAAGEDPLPAPPTLEELLNGPPHVAFHNIQTAVENYLVRTIVAPAFGALYLDTEQLMSVWRAGLVAGKTATDCTRYCLPSPGMGLETAFIGGLTRMFEMVYKDDPKWVGPDFLTIRQRQPFLHI